MKKAKVILIILNVAILAFSMTACSQKNKAEEIDKEANSESGKGNPEDVPDNSKIDEKDDNIYSKGEVVEGLELSDDLSAHSVMEYKLIDAVLYEKPGEAGIDRSQMVSSAICNMTFDERGAEFKELDEFSLLVCELDIRNIDSEELNIGGLTLVTMLPNNETKNITEPCYFSGSDSLDKPDESRDYYKYELSRGDSMEAKVAWVLDTDIYDKDNLYLCLNYMGEESLIKYIKLEL